MFNKIDTDKMNRLMEGNEDFREIIEQLLENHHTAVSTISHEIRNPLTFVSSALQMIEMQHPEVKSFSHWQETMEDIDFIRQLLEELSAFNNGTSLKLSTFSMGTFLKNIVLSFAIHLDEADPDVEFTSSVPEDLGDFTGDKIKLHEVLLNLLKNAKEAIDLTGMIRLTASRFENTLKIEIQDDGCGIPADLTDTIFEPFKTYKQGGTGLGLALSRRIIEAHRGSLTVMSAEGEGSTFTIILPLL